MDRHSLFLFLFHTNFYIILLPKMLPKNYLKYSITYFTLIKQDKKMTAIY